MPLPNSLSSNRCWTISAALPSPVSRSPDRSRSTTTPRTAEFVSCPLVDGEDETAVAESRLQDLASDRITIPAVEPIMDRP